MLNSGVPAIPVAHGLWERWQAELALAIRGPLVHLSNQLAFFRAAPDRPGIERLRVVLVHACKAVYTYGWLLEALWTGQLPAELIQHDEDRSKRDLFHAFLRQGIDEGALRPDIDPDLVVSMLMGPILFHSHLPLGEDPEEAAESLIRVILDGIARRG